MSEQPAKQRTVMAHGLVLGYLRCWRDTQVGHEHSLRNTTSKTISSRHPQQTTSRLPENMQQLDVLPQGMHAGHSARCTLLLAYCYAAVSLHVSNVANRVHASNVD